ncbi:hypothetical protein HDV03_003964 [Kappamyces sp. JEL0829]|nr:hypothetical protein HDV03_003964 [Kappamyces sp. JEL0829]
MADAVLLGTSLTFTSASILLSLVALSSLWKSRHPSKTIMVLSQCWNVVLQIWCFWFPTSEYLRGLCYRIQYPLTGIQLLLITLVNHHILAKFSVLSPALTKTRLAAFFVSIFVLFLISFTYSFVDPILYAVDARTSSNSMLLTRNLCWPFGIFSMGYDFLQNIWLSFRLREFRTQQCNRDVQTDRKFTYTIQLSCLILLIDTITAVVQGLGLLLSNELQSTYHLGNLTTNTIGYHSSAQIFLFQHLVGLAIAKPPDTATQQGKKPKPRQLKPPAP